MKKVHNLSKYVKTHKLVSLGVVASAAALVATGIGTYSYFSDSKTANTNITLNKGTVKLENIPSVEWSYLGNNASFSLLSSDSYSSETKINPDLKINAVNSAAIGTNPTQIYKGSSFSNVVPGDTFVKTYDITYTGSNEAEVVVKFTDETKTWGSIPDYYNFKVECSVGNNSTATNLIDNSSAATNYQVLSKGKKLSYSVKTNDHIKLSVYVQLKDNDYPYDVAKFETGGNSIPNLSSVSDKFEIKVNNKLYIKSASTDVSSEATQTNINQ